jgi:site-specific DNA recombinase
MQAVIYVRVSSGEQVIGTSLDSQETQCRRFCAERGFTVLEVFREEGESAKTADRTALLRALEYCRKNKGKVQAFVVAKVDRFARNTEDHFYVRKLLLERGATLYSVSEPIGNSPTEKFIETVLAAGAEFDNAIRKQRCTDGMVGRINQGIWPFHPPLGYLCARHRKRGEKKTRPDELDPKIFPIIRRTLKDYSAGRVRTLAEFAEQLDRLGLASLRQRPVVPQLVDHILSNYLDYYSGVLINPWTHTRHMGRHEPMITEAECIRIRLIRAGRLKPWAQRKDRNNPEFPLRRIVRCATCSRHFTGAFSSGEGGQYAYYFCHNPSCGMKGRTVRRAELHTQVEALLANIAPPSHYWATLRMSLVEALNERNGRISAKDESRQQRLAELTAKRSRLFEMREDGSYTKELFHERLSALEAELALVKTEAPDKRLALSEIDDAIGHAKRFCDSTLTHLLALPARTRAAFEHFVLPEGIVFDRASGVRTPILGPIFELGRVVRDLRSPYVNLQGPSLNSVLDHLEELGEIQKELDLAETLSAEDMAA